MKLSSIDESYPRGGGGFISTNQSVIGKYQDLLDKKMQTALDTTLLCGCCEWHQINKCAAWAPYGKRLLASEGYGGHDDPHKGNGTGEIRQVGPRTKCKCNCRDLSRKICKLHHDFPYLAGPNNFLAKCWDLDDVKRTRIARLNELADQIANTEYVDTWNLHPDCLPCTDTDTDSITIDNSLVQDIGIAQQIGMAGIWG